jgi:hypothetical protein
MHSTSHFFYQDLEDSISASRLNLVPRLFVVAGLAATARLAWIRLTEPAVVEAQPFDQPKLSAPPSEPHLALDQVLQRLAIEPAPSSSSPKLALPSPTTSREQRPSRLVQQGPFRWLICGFLVGVAALFKSPLIHKAIIPTTPRDHQDNNVLTSLPPTSQSQIKTRLQALGYQTIRRKSASSNIELHQSVSSIQPSTSSSIENPHTPILPTNPLPRQLIRRIWWKSIAICVLQGALLFLAKQKLQQKSSAKMDRL